MMPSNRINGIKSCREMKDTALALAFVAAYHVNVPNFPPHTTLHILLASMANTRPSNGSKHPGLPDAKKPRRSTQEVQKAKEAEKQVQRKANAAARKAAKDLAAIEDAMASADADQEVNRVTKPKIERPLVRTYAVADLSKLDKGKKRARSLSPDGAPIEEDVEMGDDSIQDDEGADDGEGSEDADDGEYADVGEDADTEDADDIDGTEVVEVDADADDQKVLSGFDTELTELATDYESSPPPKKAKVVHRDQIKAARGVSDVAKAKKSTVASNKKDTNATKNAAPSTVGKSNAAKNAAKSVGKSNAAQSVAKSVGKSNATQNAAKTTGKSNARKKQPQKATEAMSPAVAALSGPGMTKDWKSSGSECTTPSWQGPSCPPNSKQSGTTTTSRSSGSVVSAMVKTQVSTPVRPKPRPAYKGAAPTHQSVSNPTGMKVVEGGIVSEDECAEQDAARSSPIKNGKRLTSSGIVKEEVIDIVLDSDEQSEEEGSKRAPNSKSKKVLIPDEFRRNGRWRVLLSTILKYRASTTEPWTIGTDAEAIEVMNKAWEAVYGNTSVVKPASLEPYIQAASQRLCEWRSNIGNAAMGSVEAFFNSDDRFKDNRLARAEHSKDILNGLRFLWEYAPLNEEDKTKFRGLFRSSFVTDALRRHFALTRLGLSSVPGLFNKDNYPIGAIGIAAAAVERAFDLFSAQKVEVHKTGTNLTKTENRRSGQKTNVDNQFSELKYGLKTSQYARSAQGMRVEKLQKVIDSVTNPIVIADEEEDEERAMLVDYSD
ncbi:hypothetical protein A0H81_13955 [Grifola frondosa]|uniref:DUF6532 domain-containing protein n=1 Tax=Grifola frondosa TaxID=5627 RepID=A0A1C7LN91_GRIFR|nr:hypothetical protein A0H81_13955 [Grifola frondosa]